MKGCLILVLLAIVLGAIMLPLLGGEISIPRGIHFIEEVNPDYIGSYDIFRENGGVRWPEYGEWEKGEYFYTSIFTLGGPQVCLRYHPTGYFRAAPGYKWKEFRGFDGSTCLRLVRK